MIYLLLWFKLVWLNCSSIVSMLVILLIESNRVSIACNHPVGISTGATLDRVVTKLSQTFVYVELHHLSYNQIII